MTNEIIKIDNIIASGLPVLMDTGAREGGRNNWYRTSLYGVNDYSELNTKIMLESAERMEIFNERIQKSEIYTVPRVVEELLNFKDILTEKQHFLDRRANRIQSEQELDSEKKAQDVCGQQVLAHLNRLYSRCCNRVARKVFPIGNHQIFDSIERFVIDVAEKEDSKKKKYEYRDSGRSVNYNGDLKTDEQLIACGFYSSIVNGRENFILTRDSDLKQIMIDCCKNLENIKQPMRDKIKNALLKNRCIIYYIENVDDAMLITDTHSLIRDEVAKASAKDEETGE